MDAEILGIRIRLRCCSSHLFNSIILFLFSQPISVLATHFWLAPTMVCFEDCYRHVSMGQMHCSIWDVLWTLQIEYLNTYKGGVNAETMNIGEFPVYAAFTMLLIDCVLYLLLASLFEVAIAGLLLAVLLVNTLHSNNYSQQHWQQLFSCWIGYGRPM